MVRASPGIAALLLLPVLVASTNCRWVAGYAPSQPVVTADSGSNDADGPSPHDGFSDVARPDGGGCAPWSSGACPIPQQLALGSSFSCLLVAGGAVYCWGDNAGQVYGRDFPDSAWPRPVDGVKLAPAITGASDRKIAAGAGHVCGIDGTGRLVCWGFNEDGQVDPSQSAVWLAPTTRALPAGARAKSVALGDSHSCALSEDGSVYCWGTNSLGQLGTPGPSSTMRRVTLSLPMTTLACGANHCCAADGAGALRCWGAANHSQLNVPPAGMDFSDQPLPSSLSGSVKRLACGGENCCAVVDTSLLCWGDNSIDQLGLNSQVDHQGATQVPSLVDLAGVAVGGAHACARKAGGATSCWGYNRYGQAGIPLGTNSRTPQPISGAFDELALGEHHSCGIRAATVSCWGRNRAGQLGNGEQARRHTTLPVVLVGPQKVQSLAAGGYHTCALDGAGALQCWGFNLYGQAGQSSATELSLPEPYAPAQGVTGLGLGALHSCYLSGTELRCFGASWAGQLAFDPYTGMKSQPHLVNLEAVAVAAGHDHTCALDKDNKAVYCWGTNNKGQLGFPADGQVHATPIPLTALGTGNKAIAARYNVSCVINKDDLLRCWGDQTRHQIGTEQTDGSWHPQGYGSGTKVSAVALAGRHGCALLPSKQIECWGDDRSGRLGVESLATPDQVVTVPGQQKYEAIAAGWHFTCALDDNKDVYCWGANGNYGLGTDQLRSTFIPQKVALPGKVVTLAAGWEHVCALLEDETVHCWGGTSFGQLGQGTVTQTTTPLRILP